MAIVIAGHESPWKGSFMGTEVRASMGLSVGSRLENGFQCAPELDIFLDIFLFPVHLSSLLRHLVVFELTLLEVFVYRGNWIFARDKGKLLRHLSQPLSSIRDVNVLLIDSLHQTYSRCVLNRRSRLAGPSLRKRPTPPTLRSSHQRCPLASLSPWTPSPALPT